jgi:riboflavin kinase/FMN adenylyltransferase
MFTYSDLRLADLPGPTYASIGNFDGLHLGHQALLVRAQELAAADPASTATTALITFDPHPFAVLRPDRPVSKLTSAAERLYLAAALGVDVGIVHPFTTETAHLTPREFVELLKRHLNLAALVVGPDFALGRNRSGDVRTLSELGEELGFMVEVVPPVDWHGHPVRSSTIRDLLQRGEVATAATLLGRAYSVSGEVQHGDERGRTIGVPTANILPNHDKMLPADGVYATVARLCTPACAYAFPSVTNIGIRPTVDGTHHRVEAHLLDFPPPELPDNLYGQQLTLDFVERLRGEQRFDGLSALVAQINQDIVRSRAIFEAMPPIVRTAAQSDTVRRFAQSSSPT